jgi:phytoene synthase
MMTLMMGVRTPQALARACDLGVAMQLTNIARDVGEDARAGRLYLPLRWLRDAEIDPDNFLAHPIAGAPLKSVIARLLDQAERLYQRAHSGIACLPLTCRPAILAAALLYAEIGRELERRSLDSIAHRARVPGVRKAALLLRSLALSPWLANECLFPPLRAADFLIDAVARSPAPPCARKFGIGDLGPQFLRVLDTFERLERAERFGE